MVEHSRYNIGGTEDGGILKNKLGIEAKEMLEDTETILFADAYKYFFELLEKKNLKFDVKLLFQIHKYSLSPLYAWAGKIRTVELSKGGTLFCTSLHIKRNLDDFEKILEQNKLFQTDKVSTASEKLAVIHCEFNAIHPFREGNGRTIRLFLDLMAVNAGLKPIDYSKSEQKEYIKACMAGMNKDYSIMQKIIRKGLEG